MTMSNISDIKTRGIIFEKYNGHCAYCGCTLTRDNFVIDHIKPVRRGDYKHPDKGKDEIKNYNPSCWSCNSSKGVFSIEAWRNEISLKRSRLMRDSSSYRLLIRFGLIDELNNPVKFYFESYGYE